MRRNKAMKILAFVVPAFYAFVCGMIFFGMNAAAYIDPSVMTYLIQAVAGLVIALGAVFGIYFRRLKKVVMEILGIDQMKGKEVESDDIVYHKPEGKGEA